MRVELHRPVIMGVLNVTPDSFYDGGARAEVESAVAHARAMATAGALIIDVGGESTRPGAEPVPPDEELRRVIPVIEALAGEAGMVLSVDTRKAEVARAALGAGAHIVNDVSALGDPEMAGVVREHDAGIVLMHMHGDPRTMQEEPLDSAGVCAAVETFCETRLARAESAGIARASTVLDPGIGFGKTFKANEWLLKHLGKFLRFGRPLLVGASRKGFIGGRTGRPANERLAGSLAAHVIAVLHGARIIRTHDVAATRDALLVTEGIMDA
jgi:dihydropteroate synthase